MGDFVLDSKAQGSENQDIVRPAVVHVLTGRCAAQNCVLYIHTRSGID